MSEQTEGIQAEPTGRPEVDLEAEFKASNVQEVLDKLDRELIGLVPVKTRIRETAALLLVDRVRKKMQLSGDPDAAHVLHRQPGTGKTTVAMRMAEILHRLGYVREGHLVRDPRRPGRPVHRPYRAEDQGGHQEGHGRRAVHRRGLLPLPPENERDYGQESIEILLQVMENNRDDLVVILAGYKDKMDRFFHSNPGMRSRIAHHIDFPDYRRRNCWRSPS
jgi:nucleotide-binding universal stress UspA family protein